MIRPAMVMLCLFVATVIVYLPVRGYGFIEYDDPHYVSENAIVRDGLTSRGVTWAFTTGHASNWHPLTWLSHMADVTIFGPDRPGAMHMVNVVIHAISAAVLFCLLRTMTGAYWRSALVAAIFALHPLRVESVAWIAERKDVLAAFFWLATMMAYFSYARRGGFGRYALVVVLFVLGLLAKPMLVTLPIVLLAVDWVGKGPRDQGTEGPRGPQDVTHASRLGATRSGAHPTWLVIEKLPLFVLAAVSSVITLRVQAAGQSVSSMDALSLGERLATSVVAYATYMYRLFDPLPLAVLHPHPKLAGGTIAATHVLLSAAALVAVTAAVVYMAMVRSGRGRDGCRAPLFGLTWFVVSAVPVVGIVHVGQQLFADRYTYIPHIGLLIAVLWAIERLTRRLPHRAVVGGAVSVVALSLCIWQTHLYLHEWRNGSALFEHAIAVTDSNWPMHLALAREQFKEGDYARAAGNGRAAAGIAPGRAEPWTQLGNALAADGKLPAAEDAFRKALVIDPARFDALLGMGNVMFAQQRDERAEDYYAQAVQVRPSDARAQYSHGNVLMQLGRAEEAKQAFAAAMKLEPGNKLMRRQIGDILRAHGYMQEAAHYDE